MSEFERWETRFATLGYLFGTEPNTFLKSQAHLLKRGWKALSVADGEGRNGVWLAEQGLDVQAFDFSPKATRRVNSQGSAVSSSRRKSRIFSPGSGRQWNLT